jgi:hypothetical protein
LGDYVMSCSYHCGAVFRKQWVGDSMPETEVNKNKERYT